MELTQGLFAKIKNKAKGNFDGLMVNCTQDNGWLERDTELVYGLLQKVITTSDNGKKELLKEMVYIKLKQVDQ